MLGNKWEKYINLWNILLADGRDTNNKWELYVAFTTQMVKYDKSQLMLPSLDVPG